MVMPETRGVSMRLTRRTCSVKTNSDANRPGPVRQKCTGTTSWFAFFVFKVFAR